MPTISKLDGSLETPSPHFCQPNKKPSGDFQNKSSMFCYNFPKMLCWTLFYDIDNSNKLSKHRNSLSDDLLYSRLFMQKFRLEF
jgi:hypothetical protein